jgi:ketosteroid isomerase-like protein
MLTIAALGSWTTVVAATARATGSTPADLAKAIADYDRATVSNDIAALANLVADDYVLVNSDSSLQDKQSYLEDFKVPGFRLDPYELQQQVRRIWGDTALLAGVVRLSWTLKGEHQARLLRIAHVWTRQQGRWRLAYTQLTRIPEP